LHIVVWLRLHDKYANQLALINSQWDDEKLYQETKEIVIALVQHITYNEYLPSVFWVGQTELLSRESFISIFVL
jgi:hypothetical protein